jgi:aspartate/methionine/tyrosine aminotransferase
MTGWRIAFACGNPTAVRALGTVKNNLDSGQFTAIQDAAIVALESDQQCVADMCALYQSRRDLVYHKSQLLSRTTKIQNQS